MNGKPVRWETTVRTYDSDDELVSETVTTVVSSPVPSDDSPAPGMYL